MESEWQNTAIPPSYATQESTPYPKEPTPYPPSGPQQYPPPPAPQYQPTAGPPSYGQQYGYNQPPAGYPPQQGYGYGGPQYTGASPGQQPQQQQVVVVSPGQPQTVIVQHVETYVGHIVFACIVFWCCNWLFGLIAFILAMVASSTAVSDPTGARKLGHASIGLSVAGIIVTVVIVIVVIAVFTSSSCNYHYLGTCYTYKSYVGSYSYCSGVKSGSYCYHD